MLITNRDFFKVCEIIKTIMKQSLDVKLNRFEI